tara:strand:- start:136 stop:435 length:300 start_codon:yes stop_codon:yes gene_type:complete
MDRDSWKRLHNLYLADYDEEDIKKDSHDISYIHEEVIKKLAELMKDGATPMQVAGVCQAIAAQLYSKYLSTEEFVELIDIILESALPEEYMETEKRTLH